jgi:uncharacterized membrane protein
MLFVFQWEVVMKRVAIAIAVAVVVVVAIIEEPVFNSKECLWLNERIWENGILTEFPARKVCGDELRDLMGKK